MKEGKRERERELWMRFVSFACFTCLLLVVLAEDTEYNISAAVQKRDETKGKNKRGKRERRRERQQKMRRRVLTV